MPLGASFFGDVSLVEFKYRVFTRTPGGVTLGDSSLCCCVPCLSSAIIPLRLLIEYILKMHFVLRSLVRFAGRLSPRVN